MSMRQTAINNLTTNERLQGFAEIIADLPYGHYPDEVPEPKEAPKPE